MYKALKNIINLLVLAVCLIIASCGPESLENDKSNNSEVEPVVSNLSSKLYNSAEIVLDLSESKSISPLIYGVNNDWKQISEDRYGAFASSLQGINYQLVRFPGGWESEYYDWSENTTPKWANKPNKQGASISTVKGTAPNAISIVVPTVEAMNVTFGSVEWYLAVQLMKKEAIDAIEMTGEENITSIEIGNEWWLQWGGGVSRENKLVKYANIAKEIAAHIRLVFPTAGFKVLVNGDYTHPDEFSIIKQVLLDSGSLQYIDGLTLHTYTGYDSESHNIRDLQMNISACKQNLGKNYLSLSEWAPSKAYNNNKIYAEGANLLVEQMYEHALAEADEAAFWPPTNNAIPGLGLFNYALTLENPTGQLFGDMAKDFRGQVIKAVTNGAMRVVAAQKDNDEVVVYVVGKNHPHTKIEMSFNDNKRFDVISAEIWEPGDLLDTSKAVPMNKIENVGYKLKAGSRIVKFDVNKSSAYTIYKMVLNLK